MININEFSDKVFKTLQDFVEVKADKNLTQNAIVRKKVIQTEGLRELEEFSKSTSKRPARLYTFDNISLNSKRAHFIKKEKKC